MTLDIGFNKKSNQISSLGKVCGWGKLITGRPILGPAVPPERPITGYRISILPQTHSSYSNDETTYQSKSQVYRTPEKNTIRLIFNRGLM